MEDGEVLGVGVVVAEKDREGEPAQEVSDRLPLPLERAEEFGDPVGARTTGVTGSSRVLELRVVIDPVDAERLGRILLVDERDGLAVDSSVITMLLCLSRASGPVSGLSGGVGRGWNS